MTRNVRLGLALSLVLLAAACGEVPTSTADGELRSTTASAAVVPGTCTNLTQLNQLSAVIFTPGSSPNINSVKGKLKNLDGLVKKNKIAEAQAQASEIVAFTLKKHNQGGLAGTDAQVEAFTNAVLCFAGIDIEVEQPDNTFFILPSDLPQVITNIEGNAGISFPGNPVSEPTLVEISIIPGTFGAGDGPLDTKLDQYPGFIQITKTSETNAPLAKPVVVGVCASGVIPADVRARLRLGHGATAGFEVTQPAPADFITCPIQTAQAPAASGWGRVAELLMPAKAHAFQMEFGGGVGGTVTEFSPFAPVDPVLEFGGGVGGTVTEFTRMGMGQSALLSDVLTLMGACPTPIEGAMGSPVRDECRPNITVRTRLGTPFVGVPVNWNVTLGGGSIAANTGTCGTFGTAAATTTGPNGGAGICWTLGAVGANRVVATPTLGGDALDGVSFAPASFTFDAVANPPAGVVFSLQPPASIRAGVGFPAAVTVVDKNGERVYGSADEVAVRMSAGTFLNGVTQVRVKAVQGVSNFPALPSTVTGTFTLVAAGDFAPLATTASSAFDVTAGFAWTIVPSAGNGQTGIAGQAAPVNPTVLVSDKWGNPVAGALINWSRINSTFTQLIGQSTTDATGQASIAWTLTLGANQLRAGLNEGSFATTIFTATGNAP
jgi:hypothetical protein